MKQYNEVNMTTNLKFIAEVACFLSFLAMIYVGNEVIAAIIEGV